MLDSRKRDKPVILEFKDGNDILASLSTDILTSFTAGGCWFRKIKPGVYITTCPCNWKNLNGTIISLEEYGISEKT